MNHTNTAEIQFGPKRSKRPDATTAVVPLEWGPPEATDAAGLVRRRGGKDLRPSLDVAALFEEFIDSVDCPHPFDVAADLFRGKLLEHESLRDLVKAVEAEEAPINETISAEYIIHQLLFKQEFAVVPARKRAHFAQLMSSQRMARQIQHLEHLEQLEQLNQLQHDRQIQHLEQLHQLTQLQQEEHIRQIQEESRRDLAERKMKVTEERERLYSQLVRERDEKESVRLSREAQMKLMYFQRSDIGDEP